MKIVLKKVKTFVGREGMGGFSADLYINGEHVGTVIDQDNGGELLIQDFRESRELVNKAYKWAATLPKQNLKIGGEMKSINMTLETLIEDEFQKHLQKLDDLKFKAISKKAIIWGLPDARAYHVVKWKKHTLATMVENPNGISIINAQLQSIKKIMSPNEIILNADYLRSLGCNA